MMYRRRQSSSLLTVIVLGVIAGTIFMLYQRWSAPTTPPAPTPTVAPTLVPTLTTAPLVIPTPTYPVITARLSIPTAGIVTPVVDVYLDGVSWDVRYLGDNAGHLQGTAWLRDTGNVVLAGHVETQDGRAGIFAAIRDLQLGDPVVLTDGAAVKRYTVTEVKTVQPDDLTVLYPTTTDQITLITCDGYNFLDNTYEERVVVVGQRVA